MIFSSPVFIIFFFIYLILHVLLPLRLRLSLIIAGSTVFYGYWNPYYIWIPFFLMSIAYYGAIWVMNAATAVARRRHLVIVMVALVMPLLIAKYTNFIYQDVLGLVAGFNGQLVDWHLPLGISFITFTLIAYVVDVYYERYPLVRDIRMLTGYALFFPYINAGPILRPAELLPQLQAQKQKISAQALLFGTAIFSIGLLKKLVFADPIAESVQYVYSPEDVLTGMDYLIGIYGYALQIYCDFSGYTDMAIGAALIIGIKLPMNFQRPYLSSSTIEFWTRWHITLSRWLRDYLYIPLGGNRLGYRRQTLNLFTTMAICGLWHGANWNFVLWGLAHGVGISFVHTVRKLKFMTWLGRIPRFFKVFITFHFVTACWILFRSPDLSTAWRIASGPFLAPWNNFHAVIQTHAFAIILLFLFVFSHYWDDHEKIIAYAKRAPKALFWSSMALIWILAITISQGSSAKFIYFDF